MKKSNALCSLVAAAGLLVAGSTLAQQQPQPDPMTPAPPPAVTSPQPPMPQPGKPGEARPSGGGGGGATMSAPSGAGNAHGAHHGGKSGQRGAVDQQGSVGATPMGSSSGMTPRQYQKGDTLPAEYRDRQYTIDDYKQYGLSAPPKGQRWVGIGDQYLLVGGKNSKVMSVGSASR